MGRPTTYTPELAAKICALLAEGKSLRAICEAEEMPAPSTVCGWVLDSRYLLGEKSFAEQYARARDIGLDVMADEVLKIADTPQEGVKVKSSPLNGEEITTADMIEHRRLQVDTRKWYLSKLAPKRYGDKLQVDHSGELSIVERLARGRQRSGS